jgi:dipeptidyl aminopeptidase/acylaminoacyl peptidase
MNVRSAALAVGILAIATLAINARPAAQTPRTMTFVSLAEIPRLQDIQLSTDGRSVSYMLGRADWKANRFLTHIWLQPVSGGPPTQLTNGAAGELLARWSPDSRALLFLSAGQISVVAADGGTSRQVTHHATSVYGGSVPAWSADGSSIYFLASDPLTDGERERERLRDDVFVFEEDYKQRHLWTINVESGIEQRLTDGPFSVVSFRLSRDGTQIAEQRAPSPLAADLSRGEIWSTDASGLNAHAITSNTVEELEAEISPDKTRVLFLAEANARLAPYYSSQLFIVPASGGTPTPALPDFPYAVEHATWSPDGTAVLAVVNVGTHSELFRIDLATRTPTALTDGQHSVLFWSLTPAASRMVFQFDEPTRLGDGWTLPVNGGIPTRVTGLYDSLATDFALPRQEKISWHGADGVTVEGLLFYPAGYQAGTRYPLVVQLHAGPHESDKFGFGPGVLLNYLPVLTAKGYAVLRPNYRGSAGYGSAFMRDVVGGYFKNMHLDVMAGVDAVIRSGIADPDRLAVMGLSAGAHLTNKLITFTTRFKAASSTAGVANWVSLFAESDTRDNRTPWFGGMPWGPNAPVDAFWNNSPIKDASKIRTPTLLMAGENDARVPLPQAIEMFRALTANAVPTRLYIAPREPHQWQELRHQLFKANAELEWFDRYVLGRSYVWERPPTAAQ